MPDAWFSRPRARRLREQAVRYADNGWPVAPLAVPHDNGAEPYLAGEAVSTGPEAEGVWRDHGWDIALIAARFEVMELPAEYGALLNHTVKARCPTAMLPAHRRWWFFLEPGSVDADRVTAADGVLHRDWVPAPGTRLESTGRIRWLVPPYLTGWRPYRPYHPIDAVLP